MRGCLTILFWVFIICMVVAYCNRENKDDSIVVTTTEMVRDFTHTVTNEVDSTWHAKDSVK